MKRFMNLWLMAALLGGLSLSVASCKDDDDKLSAEEQAEKEQSELAEQAQKFWNVVGQLVGTANVTDDYQTKTFTATIGDASETNPTVREVMVNELQAAAQRFCDLAGLDQGTVDENTATYTWQDGQVGTLTYTRSTGDASLATVDVDIRQVPGLRQIVFLTPEQKGKNGGLFDFAFKGVCYYRFGDVISKPNADGKLDYWVCVRPAFGPEGKKDSHWITVSALPQNNIKHLRLGGHDYYVPTNLSKSTTHMQNLAEMLYALVNPESWQQNVQKNAKMPMFGDFSHSRVQYHNEFFWKMVAQAWQVNEVTEKLFGIDTEELQTLVNDNRLYFLAEGYSNIWPSKSVTLYQYHYSNGQGKEANMHHMDYTKRSKDVVNPYIEMNFTIPNFAEFPAFYSSDFFADESPRFVVRFASGKELMGSQPSQFQSMNNVNGIKDVYVYNKYYGRPTGTDADIESEVMTSTLKNDPAKWNKTAFVGYGHYRMGYIYKDEEGNRWVCISQSGIPEEKSPYAELISFEGLTASADKRCITNLPSRNKAIRAGFWLNQFFTQISENSNIDKLSDYIGKEKDYGASVINCRQWADCDPSVFFQRIQAQNGDPRSNSYAASIAYNDGSGRQRLLRWIMNIQNTENHQNYYLADNYVDKPKLDEPRYGEDAYGQTPVYLDDLASLDMIGYFSPDSYATQPLSMKDAKNNDGPTEARNYRTAADKDATDATKYFYSMEKWANRTFKTDMWNAPILMFRYTRVYDRGDDEFASLTTDGHYLTLFKEHGWLLNDEYAGSPEQQAADKKLNYETFVTGTLNLQVGDMNAEDAWHLNGKIILCPKWNTIVD